MPVLVPAAVLVLALVPAAVLVLALVPAAALVVPTALVVQVPPAALVVQVPPTALVLVPVPLVVQVRPAVQVPPTVLVVQVRPAVQVPSRKVQSRQPRPDLRPEVAAQPSHCKSSPTSLALAHSSLGSFPQRAKSITAARNIRSCCDTTM